MNPLARRIASRIALTGPITVADFMAEALTHPQLGYYRRADPLGRGGDFITAPEISQMFGELIGAWCAERWLSLGRPDPCAMVELGPGRGTLMADALRATRAVPGFHAALRLHLVEVNPTLRAQQAAALAAVAPELAPAWHDSFAGVPDGAPMLLVANEFFDALPVRQLVRTPAGWCERLVALDESGTGFRFIAAPGPSPLAALLAGAVPADPPPGALAEVSPQALALAHGIGERIARTGGAALIVDYGRAESGLGASLQAVRGHRRADPLAEPGEADLSVHVDFAALGRAVRQSGAIPWGPVTQGALLAALGVAERARRLKARATDAQRAAVDAALARLIEPAQMGTLFKALAITGRAESPPAGFAAPA